MPTPTDSVAVTRDIRVTVQPTYEPDHSEPVENRYIFSYHVTIRNEGEGPVTLLNRHWIIINGEGDREEVTGPGVVGFTPTINPGEEFDYSSYCPLNTVFGTMEGSYGMVTPQGESFEVEIGRFYLVAETQL
ncbi:Co2+/Mg2+ efflux protein ApaG [bacterium]|nr:Co2+/Mg2+ efflux protein ApaG [bacterium]